MIGISPSAGCGVAAQLFIGSQPILPGHEHVQDYQIWYILPGLLDPRQAVVGAVHLPTGIFHDHGDAGHQVGVAVDHQQIGLLRHVVSSKLDGSTGRLCSCQSASDKKTNIFTQGLKDKNLRKIENTVSISMSQGKFILVTSRAALYH